MTETTDRIAEIQARYVEAEVLALPDDPADVADDVAVLLDALRHMTESWETAEAALQENTRLRAETTDYAAAITRVVMLASNAINSTREENRKIAAETGRPSTMRAFVFADDVLTAFGAPVAEATDRSRTAGSCHYCATGPLAGSGCFLECDLRKGVTGS